MRFGTANAALAKAKNLVGMEVPAVDGAGLGPATIALTLYARAADAKPVDVRFVRR